jgi:hypothetical protein
MTARKLLLAGAGFVVLAGVLAVCVVLGPSWIVGEGLGGPERLKAENDVRGTLLQALGGLLALGGVGIGAVMTVRQVGANREGNFIGLFTKAIDQLASDEVSVRHGGIYALERLSSLDAEYRGHAHALLTAFIRQRAPWPARRPEEELAADRARLQGGLPDDIGAALGVLGRGEMITEGAYTVLDHVDLRDGDLRHLSIPRLYLRHATLAGADLSGADLSGADLGDTDLTGVVADETTKWPPGFKP